MYAIVETGGKQYMLKKADVVDLERVPLGKKKELKLDKVLLVSDSKKIDIGTPHLKGAKVICEVIEEIKTKKVLGMHFRRRKDSKVTFGHRQKMVRVKVTGIER